MSHDEAWKETLKRLAKAAWEKAHPPISKVCKRCKKPSLIVPDKAFCKKCETKLRKDD